MKFPKIIVLIVFACISCQPPSANQSSPVVVSHETETNDGKIISFLGSELPPKQISDTAKIKLEENLRIAKEALEANPDSIDLIIWYGRRLAYLGRYLEAIDAFSDGIAKYPNSHRLRRHRGHRYISTRQLDQAISDYELAAFNSTNKENQIEPDGIPNKLNKPLGNDKFNIYYHFGLAHYLDGRFDKAVSAYTKCMEYSDNNDLLVATSYWLYMSLKRIGNNEEAEELLEPISSSLEIIENNAYLKLLLLFKGEKSEEETIAEATNEDGSMNPTLAYGIGNWYLQNNRIDDARNLFWKTLESPQWDAFGYIATEADINNMATSSN